MVIAGCGLVVDFLTLAQPNKVLKKANFPFQVKVLWYPMVCLVYVNC